MNNQSNAAGEQLENAFQLFNQFSEKLAGSYSVLESHVTQLSKELAEARSERLIQLAEKEVLAIRLEGLLDALPAGIVVLDADDCITQTNPVARLMLAAKHDNNKLIGEKWQSIAQKSMITDGNELRLINGHYHGSKDACWVSISACPLVADSSGSNPGKIILISDITENRNLQIKLNRQQRLSSLGEMIASLAHQIRTPLSSALLYISTLNHPWNDDKERIRFTEKAKERLHHLERMVNDMLIFARGDVSASEYINTFEFMTQLKNLFEADYRVEKKRIVIDKNLKKVVIQANHDVLLSAIQNIIDNAIEACIDNPESNEASIKIKAFLNDNNQFEINIEDNGCGMSDEIKERVLEPFFTTRTKGTGLGLAVVSATLNHFTGEMNIHSTPDVGSKFNITFPRAEVAAMLPSNLSMIKQIASRKIHSINEKKSVIEAQEVAL